MKTPPYKFISLPPDDKNATTAARTFLSDPAALFDPSLLVNAIGNLPDTSKAVREIIINKSMLVDVVKTWPESTLIMAGVRISVSKYLPDNMLVSEYCDGMTEVILWRDGKMYRKTFDKNPLKFSMEDVHIVDRSEKR